jgi:hypothetical protein
VTPPTPPKVIPPTPPTPPTIVPPTPPRIVAADQVVMSVLGRDRGNGDDDGNGSGDSGHCPKGNAGGNGHGRWK